MKKIYSLVVFLIVVLGIYLAFQSTESSISPKEIISKGIEQYKQKNPLTKDDEVYVKLQLAISNYISTKNSPPESLMELIPTYFDTLPKDPSTGKPYEYKLVGRSYKLGTGKVGQADSSQVKNDVKNEEKKDDIKEDFINPNKIVLEDFVYDSTGKRDPFKPFTDKQEVLIDESAPPLQRYELSQLRVAAILSDSSGGRFAMVEDATGRGYPVKLGDVIGVNKGKVVSVDIDRVDVLETITDAAGQVKQELQSIKLVAGGGEAKNLKNRPKSKKR